MNKHEALVAPAPTFGPAVVSIFGLDVPVAAMGLSMLTLVLVRIVFKPGTGKRKLTRLEDGCLTALLVIILFAAVTGQFWNGGPMGVGMAVAWAIGLGFSGMLVLEIVRDSWLAAFRRLTNQMPMGGPGSNAPAPQDPAEPSPPSP